jgi:hypothetical protein
MKIRLIRSSTDLAGPCDVCQQPVSWKRGEPGFEIEGKEWSQVCEACARKLAPKLIPQFVEHQATWQASQR